MEGGFEKTCETMYAAKLNLKRLYSHNEYLEESELSFIEDERNSNRFGEWLTKNSIVGKHVVVVTVEIIKTTPSKNIHPRYDTPAKCRVRRRHVLQSEFSYLHSSTGQGAAVPNGVPLDYFYLGKCTYMLHNVIAQPRFTTDVNTSVVARLPVHTSKGLTIHPEEGSLICKHFLSTEEFPNAYTKRREVPKTVVQNVCSSRNVRTRLTTGQPSLSANLSSLPTSAEQHLHTTDILKNRRTTDTNDTITLRPTKVETTITVIKIFDPTGKSTAHIKTKLYQFVDSRSVRIDIVMLRNIRFQLYSNRIITGPRYFCTNPPFTIAYLKGGQDMYKQGLLATVNVDKLGEVGGLDYGSAAPKPV
ncbi:hypothetical protein Tco_0412173 [Tanacetum coccineum]